MKLRQWTPEDTEELLGWLEEDPEYLDKMEFVQDATPVGIIHAITQIMVDPQGLMLAAESGGQLIGYVVGVDIQPGRSATVHGGAAPKHQSKGGLIMRAGINKAFNGAGLETLVTMVPKDRPEILKLDKALGFQEPSGHVLVLTKEVWDG